MPRTVITYFSASGTTRNVARQIAKLIEADLYEIRPARVYTDADLNWMNKKSRSSKEMEDLNSRPDLAETDLEIDNYQTIYIGFPIWWYTAPRIINSFIERYNFTDKRIVLFATSGSSNIDKAITDLRNTYPALNIVGGKLLNRGVSNQDLNGL